jgi:uncharacterized protein YndB with AHSA1/START domain
VSVQKEPDGRRAVEVQVEVPGTPEEVWRAIATGPGISSWFVRTDVDEREGGQILFHLGPGMDSAGVITGIDAPRKLTYEERDWSPGAPPLATECIVEARAGGTCLVRMVHSLFASSEAWDDQLESFEAGWPGFFRILKLYLTHFRGQSCVQLRLSGGDPGPESEAWNRFVQQLGLSGAKPGERSSTSSITPALQGVVESTGSKQHCHELLLQLNEPAGGLALLGAYTWDGRVHVNLSLYLYGKDGAAAALRGEAAWTEWMANNFPIAKSETAPN